MKYKVGDRIVVARDSPHLGMFTGGGGTIVGVERHLVFVHLDNMDESLDMYRRAKDRIARYGVPCYCVGTEYISKPTCIFGDRS